MPLPPLINALRQCFFLPKPTITEHTVGDLTGKTILVTGGNSGVGYELCQLLYGLNANVFLAGRNAKTCSEAVASIRAKHPRSSGRLEFIQLDLSDLASIPSSAAAFLEQADRLDYLANNAGVMGPPKGSKGAQGHELQQATNCIGAYLLTKLLKPLLVQTARTEKSAGRENVVRVSWAGSLAIEGAPKYGMSFVKDAEGLDEVKVIGTPMKDYGTSKTGNLYLAKDFGDEVEGEGIVSVRHLRKGVADWVFHAMAAAFLYDPVYGAYTELWCGFSPDLTTADNGTYIGPWGRKFPVRWDIEQARSGEVCTRYSDWIRRQIKPYLSVGAPKL